MSWFVATIYDRFMAESERACLAAWRHALLGELTGSVIEIGAGTGRNLDHYPLGLERLVLAEPDRHMRSRLRALSTEHEHPAEVIAAPAQALPVDSESFDVVVCTLVLCSVADVDATLAEARRVLKPGGRFVFIEHVAAEGGSRLAWQRRVEPVWKRIADGCHLTRRTGESLERAGFELSDVKRESMRKALSIVRPTLRGVARKKP
ncbi:MAG: methyltransferase domain-containing protein [Myxococcales bacterium]|nr:methyltransferase domain-containing protein [Myxococcales bacterium]MCB9580844.1 methyltransferase domain-containing protein [Polyangiaceae bacterium]